jgi:hypothetical protein
VFLYLASGLRVRRSPERISRAVFVAASLEEGFYTVTNAPY